MKRFLMLILCTMVYIGLSQSSSAQPSNDEATGAISIVYGQNGPFTTVDATPNPTDLDGGQCSTNDWSEPDVQSSVWFTFVGDGNEVSITTNNDCVPVGVVDIIDTQIAVFEGAADGTNIACHDDISGANFYSTVQFTTTVGTTYYILVDGWANASNPLIVGEFCIDVSDANTIFCNNGICDVGEDFTTCPDDCPCLANSIFVDIVSSGISTIPIAYCNSDSSLIPLGSIGIAVSTFGGLGDFTDFPYDLTTDVGTTSGQLISFGSSVSIGFVFLTQADLDAGGTVNITFQSTINSCSGTLSFDIADLNITDIAVSCYVPVCGDGICELGENSTNCPSDCPTVCGNGICELGENNANCLGDCPAICGNDICELGEDNATCPGDCPFICGDGICEIGEDSATCPGDCQFICGNGICEEGEDFTTCTNDCPCLANSVFVDLFGSGISATAIAYCNSDTSAIPVGSIGIAVSTFGGLGDFTDFPYDLTTDIGTTSGQIISYGNNSASIGFLFLTQADLDAGGTVTITFQSTINVCSSTLSFNIADLNITDITAFCRVPVCGDGICELGENSTNCPSDCPVICGAFELGPWPDIRNTSCIAGETVEAGFFAWPNEAYILDVIAGTQYTFSICNGFDPDILGWNGGVVLSAYEDVNGDEIIDDVNNPIATGTSCSLTFTAVQDGVILLVVNDADCTGVGEEVNNGFVSITTDTNCEEDCQLNIPMPYAGWHMISSYCNPLQDSITQVFSPIVNDIIQIKNLTGQVYVPSFNNFNTFTTWDITQGYLVKTFAPVTLPINGGLPVDLNVDQIPLYTGWNMIAYWLQGDADAIDVFSNIATDVIQVKNLSGAYVPSFNDFNNMGNMEETRGYQVKMGQGNTLQYNTSNILPRPAPGANTDDKHLQPVHFTKNIKPNPNTSTLLIMDDENNSLNYGDELGVFNESGLLVGSFVYENAMMGGLIFGDDETEEGVDGILANEEYLFKVWDSVLEEEHEVEMNFIQGNSTYQKDDLCVVSFKASSTTGINEIIGLSINANPNPATTQLTFDLEIEQAGFCNIGIYSIDGKMIDVIANRNFAAGTTQLTYNVEHLKAGLYMYRVVNGKQSYTDRFAVVR